MICVKEGMKPNGGMYIPTGHIALTDFGLSKYLSPGARTSTFCGTAEYLAPEQLRRTPYCHSVDWWAFGIFVYEMLTGRSPFFNKSRTSMYERIVNEVRQMTSCTTTKSGPDVDLTVLYIYLCVCFISAVQEPNFPEDMSPEAVDLLRGLLEKDPSIRLGGDDIKEIRDHAFFRYDLAHHYDGGLLHHSLYLHETDVALCVIDC